MSKTHDLASNAPKKKSSIGRTIVFLFILILIIAGAVAGFILFETEKPIVSLKDDITYLGKSSEIPFQVTDRRSGIKSITFQIEQKGNSKELYKKTYERRTWMNGAGPDEVQDKAVFDNAKAKFKDGEAELIITVQDFSLNGMLRGNSTVSKHQVTIDTRPPKVAIKHTQRYIRPGGSGLIIYDMSEPVASHGVIVNDQFFPGFPMAERENRYLAYIALPWDTSKIQLSRVVATDEAGNEGKSVFSMVLKQKKYKSDRINVSENFLSSKIPEFEGNSLEEIRGDTLLDKFLYVNNDVRRLNAQKISDICSDPLDKRLWQDRFLRMSGQNMAGYAEQRTYYYNNKAIDQQVHLGMDIASTVSVAIKAANRGKVIFADYLGIYGNTVVLDHGQGVFSLYSHLSRIDTTLDEVVDQGAIIAHSGSTGMAGGDHLHFSILINGVFVTPIEWMDQNWIDLNITEILSEL
jgi:murein DD-endopeptidase MepM/ murein hydrolase activator NlpD